MLNRRTFAVLAAAVVVAAIVVLGVIAYFASGAGDEEVALPQPTGQSQPGGESAPADLSAFYQQKLDWEDCFDSDKCTWVTVPVNYAKPKGDTLKLRVRYRPPAGGATGNELFINPGGPGGSGVDYVPGFAAAASPSITEHFGIVGFDPRGVARSAPIDCLTDDAFDKFISVDPDPDNQSEVDEYVDQMEKLGDACAANNGDLLNHVSTIEVARDLDVLRAVFGEQKLDYYGASYGTLIGASYAELFPENVGKMVLDGAIDPTLSDEEQGFGQAKGFQGALEAYAKNCVDSTVCPIGRDVGSGLDKIGALMDRLDQNPLPTAGKRELDEARGFYGVAVTLYARKTWPLLTAGLQAAIEKDNGSVLLQLSDAYLSRADDGSYKNNSGEVIYAVRCLDNPSSVTVDDVRKLIPEYVQASPVFGRIFAWGALGCSSWPAHSTEQPLKIDAEGAAPIVVVGTTRDPATPYVWAQALAKQLDSGVLVTRVGDGHTAYSADNACIDDAVDDYLLGKNVPEDGLVCK